ncbi:hypothetical protein TNCV_4974331 [Trichonephila clavipes]|uniref:Uncharacterized protein n=1 Tax=Trichonephila clavipes TaxID=2585209 RepID=A0A8X6VL67_TRICX|nr:hypothetical protein TNCV_4974331 [Trichonephila clavipes]
MFHPSSFANPTPLAHTNTSRDVLPKGGTHRLPETTVAKPHLLLGSDPPRLALVISQFTSRSITSHRCLMGFRSNDFTCLRRMPNPARLLSSPCDLWSGIVVREYRVG